MSERSQNLIFYAICVSLAYFGARYLLPVLMPFLLGAGLALAAEPLVALLGRKLPRGAATGIGVTLTFAILALITTALCVLAVRELGILAAVLPELLEAAKGGMESLELFLTDLVMRSPESVRPLLIERVEALFSSGSALLDKGTVYNRPFREKVLAEADAQGVKWQYRKSANGSTDASVGTTCGSAAIAFGLAAPVRYIHCACNVAYLPDLEEVRKLAEIVIKEAGELDV